MSESRRFFITRLLSILAAAGVVSSSGCSGGGMFNGEPKKYEGGGPLPEMKGEEVSDDPRPKTKKR